MVNHQQQQKVTGYIKMFDTYLIRPLIENVIIGTFLPNDKSSKLSLSKVISIKWITLNNTISSANYQTA
jgi:hypothetical protein